MDLSEFINIISLVFGFSGWVTFIYTWITNKPNVKGRIFTVITGQMPSPENPLESLTTFNIYLYLTNTRKNIIHILDYELEVDTGKGFEKVDRVFGANLIPNWNFTSQTHTVIINDYPKKLITANAKPLEQGIPLHGFVLFASKKPMEMFQNHVKRYKITCIDALNNRHLVISRPKDFPNLYLVEDLAGIRLIPKKPGDQ